MPPNKPSKGFDPEAHAAMTAQNLGIALAQIHAPLTAVRIATWILRAVGSIQWPVGETVPPEITEAKDQAIAMLEGLFRASQTSGPKPAQG
jgi:hypothetical protein